MHLIGCVMARYSSQTHQKKRKLPAGGKVSDSQQSSWSEFWVLWGHTSRTPIATPLVWFLKIWRCNLFEEKSSFSIRVPYYTSKHQRDLDLQGTKHCSFHAQDWHCCCCAHCDTRRTFCFYAHWSCSRCEARDRLVLAKRSRTRI